MTYSVQEHSDAQGSPLECYKFEGTNKNYYYTTADREVIIDGNTYIPATMQRSEIEIGTQEEDNLELIVTVPSGLDIVAAYTFNVAPPKLNLTIYRFHDGDNPTLESIKYWTGVVATFVWKGHLTEIHCPPIFAYVLATTVPNKYYQSICNNTLFDFNCKLNRADFVFTTTIVSITTITVVLAAAPPSGDGFLVTGDFFALDSQEHRMIISNIGTQIVLSYPCSDVKVGDVVELTAGCDHAGGTCKNKFNNKKNFAGFEMTPNYNPFVYGL